VTSGERYTTMCQELRSIVDDVGGVLLTLPASPAEVFRLSLLADHLREKISNYKKGKRIIGRVETRDEWQASVDARVEEKIAEHQTKQAEDVKGLSEAELAQRPHSDRRLR
jgi:hypothetical protein